jgi:hypothetical protein
MSTAATPRDGPSVWRRVISNPAWLAAIFLALLMLRRGQQLLSPQVWAEDGTEIIRGFINGGTVTLFKPVSGYLLLVPKLISWLSLGVSFSFYPYVSTILTWLFLLGVLLLIALHPSKLAGGAWLSLAVLMVPTSPETFGIPLQTLWWASLLLVVAVFWDEQADHFPLRIGCIVLGGLSSPMIVMVVPLFWARAWLYRGLRREWLLAAVASLCFAVQLSALIRSGAVSGVPGFTGAAGMVILGKFFGYYAIGQMRVLREPWVLAAVGVLLLGVAGIASWRQRRTAAVWFLWYLLLGSIALSVTRTNVLVLHPWYAGPRYFFFPYILLSWLLLQVAASRTNRRWLRRTAQVILVIAALNALPHFWKGHDDLHWREHVASSIDFDNYAIPVQRDGKACATWYLTVTGAQAATWLSHDPLRAWGHNLAAYPCTVVPCDVTVVQPRAASRRAVQRNGWQIATTASTVPAGFAVFRSSWQRGAGSLTLRLNRGDRLLFRSSENAFELTATIGGADSTFAGRLLPSTAWKWLEFSNRRLPATFTLTLQDQGTDPRQWAEVAIAP